MIDVERGKAEFENIPASQKIVEIPKGDTGFNMIKAEMHKKSYTMDFYKRSMETRESTDIKKDQSL